VRIGVLDDARAATRQGGSTVTSVAVFFLILAPALVIVTGAEALPYGTGTQSRAHARTPAAGSTNTARAGGRADDPGLVLLQEAASAGRIVSYAGVQIISWWSPDGTTTVAVDVTHQPRQGTLLQTVGADAAPAGQTLIAGGPGAQPSDVLGVTEETLDLLSANYQVVTGGPGSACDRPATLVDARRGDGTLAARFWLDNVTKIPLRRELFDDSSRMINESTFVDFQPGLPTAAASVQAKSATAAAAAARPWNVLTAVGRNRLRAKGWPLPAELPGGLVLFDARQAVTASGPVVQLGYSDGLAGVSLFVQRGGLPRRLAGWQQVEVAGRTVYARDPAGQGITWSTNGHVLTLIADAPAATIDAAVRALPHDAQRGFWSRVGHGFGRIISWVDPFR
jgi:negative regulator of sigma E activity